MRTGVCGACLDMCLDMRADMCADMCVDMCADMCIDMCLDMFVGIGVDMCADMCTGMQPGTDLKRPLAEAFFLLAPRAKEKKQGSVGRTWYGVQYVRAKSR